MKLGFDFGGRGETEMGTRRMREIQMKIRRGWWNNPFRYFLVLLVCALALSYVSVLRLGEGGEVTFLSMLFLCLIGYIVHPAAGLGAALLYAVLRYCFDYVLPGHVDTVLREYGSNHAALQQLLSQIQISGYRAMRPQLMLSATTDRIQVAGDLFDFLFGYGLLGLFGFLEALTVRSKEDDAPRKVFSFQGAYLAVVILRYIESVINYLVFYPEPGSALSNLWDALFYSFLYVCVEGLLTLLVLSIPQVMQMILFLRTVARSRFDERIFRET